MHLLVVCGVDLLRNLPSQVSTYCSWCQVAFRLPISFLSSSRYSTVQALTV